MLKKIKKKVGKDVHVKGYVCGSCDSDGATGTTRTGTTSSGQGGGATGLTSSRRGTTRAGITSFRYMDQIVLAARTPKN